MDKAKAVFCQLYEKKQSCLTAVTSIWLLGDSPFLDAWGHENLFMQAKNDQFHFLAF